MGAVVRSTNRYRAAALVVVVLVLSVAASSSPTRAVAPAPTHSPGLAFVLAHMVEVFTDPGHWSLGQPCGIYTSFCRAALRRHGLDPNGIRTDYVRRDGWAVTNLQAFGWVMWCESRYEVWVRGFRDPHDRGLWQINVVYHPGVSDTVAFDPWLSTLWTAEQWAAGQAWWWKCFQTGP